MNAQPPDAPRAPKGRASSPTYLGYAGVGVQFALTFLACGAIGWWLDRKFGSDPWLMIGGIFVGAAGAMYSLVLRVRSADRRSSDDSVAQRRKSDSDRSE